MKYALTMTIITLISLSSNAQAEGSVSAYILQKRIEAAKTERESNNLVRKLRNLPKNTVYIVNTTPTLNSGNSEMLQMPTAEDLEAIETASGSSRVAATEAVK